MNTYYRIVSMVWVLAVAAWLAPLFAQTNEPNCGNNDPCGVTGMCTPCTNECTGELEECPEPDDSAGVNAFRMYTANAFRAVPDVQMWGGAGQHKLTWTRHANSRYDETAGCFGHGQNWRHSYQWEIADAGYDGYGRAIIEVHYPDGQSSIFTKMDATRWNPYLKITDRITQNGTQFTMQRRDGYRYTFNRYSTTNGSYYRMDGFTDAFGNAYTFAYDSENKLTRVTEPAGRFIEIAYQDISCNDVEFSTFAYINATPPANQYTEITVTDTNQYRYLRYNGPDWMNSTVAEVEFYDATGTNKLTGTPFGATPAYGAGKEFDKAFDGLTNTWYSYAQANKGFTGIDLGSGNAQRVGKVRFFPLKNYEYKMNGGWFQGSMQPPATEKVIARVQSSDGRSVRYNYGVMVDTNVTDASYVVLTNAVYGDGTKAVYTYEQTIRGTQPSLVTANDPRYKGTGARIKYEYANTRGRGLIYRERNFVTGTGLVRLDSVSATDQKVTYANGTVQQFHQPATNYGHVAKRTDTLGRSTTFGYGPGSDHLKSKTDPLGRTTYYDFNEYGLILTNTLPDGSKRIWTRDDLGLPLTKIDELNRMTVWQRDAAHRATNVVHQDGSSEQFTYNAYGQVTSHKMRNGGVEYANYDASGLMTNRIDALGNLTTYTYSSNDLLIAVTDANGHMTVMNYDERGQVTMVMNADGSYRTFAYDAYGNRTNTVDELGRSSSTTYDEFSRVLSKIDPLGRKTTFAYDNPTGGSGGCGCSNAKDKPTKIVTAGGETNTLTYNLEWEKISETAAAGTAEAATTTYQYDTAGNLIAMTDPRGKTWTTTYDNRNRRSSSTDPLGNTTSWDYDAVGNRTVQIDANGKLTFWTYDAMNRVSNEVRKVGDADPAPDADDAVTRYRYDIAGNMVSVTDPNGNATSYGYDLLNRRVVTTNAAGEVSSVVFDPVGNVVTNLAANGNVTVYTYDNRNRAVQIADATGIVAQTTYDAAGNRIVQTDGNGNSISNTFDAANQLIAVRDALGNVSSNAYDNDGNLLVAYDRLGHTMRHSYDARHRRISTTDALTNTTHFSYDANGNLTQLTDANDNATQYGYDFVNRRTNEVYADGGVRSYSYDAVGNLTSRTDPAGRTANNTYNDLYYLTQHATAGFPADNFAYDKGGRMTYAERNGWIVSNAYDSVNRVVSSVQNGKTVSYSYNVAAGTRTVTYPGGRVVTENRDSRNRLGSLTDSGGMIAQFAYDNGDRTATRSYRNGTLATYSYDANNRITSLIHTHGGSTIAGFLQGYDAEGNKLYEHKTHATSASEAYAYDLINQLIDYRVGMLSGSSIPSPTLQKNYVLDPVGNWNSVTGSGSVPPPSESRTHNNVNEITAINGTNITHDANGNLTNDGVKQYDYDEENRLIRVTRLADSQVLGEYAYDALGRRILSAAYLGGVTNSTCFLFDGLRVLEDQDCAAGTTLATYTYGNYIDEVLTMTRGANTYFYHHNTLWSSEALTDSSGVTVERYSYDAYGAPPFFDSAFSPQPSSSVANRYLFTGREHDPESGLYHYRARAYDQAKGRFLQRDSIQHVDGMTQYDTNFYGYVYNNPHEALWLKRNPVNDLHFAQSGNWKPSRVNDAHSRYSFIHNRPLYGTDPLGLFDWGPFGGDCCNNSPNYEWYLNEGQWYQLAPGECTDPAVDCDGMTCGGGFYYVGGMETGTCTTPGCDSPPYDNRRWTPDAQDPGAIPPGDDGTGGDNRGAKDIYPEGYEFGPRPPCSCADPRPNASHPQPL